MLRFAFRILNYALGVLLFALCVVRCALGVLRFFYLKLITYNLLLFITPRYFFMCPVITSNSNKKPSCP